MKILLPIILILTLGFSPETASAFTTADTNRINELNIRSLDLAYSNPKHALEIVRKTIQLSKETGFVKGEIMALIRRGIIYDVISEPENAVRAYEEALALSRKAKYPKGEGSALNNIGLIYMNQHNLKEARVYFQKAYDIFLVLNNELLLGSISNNLGMIYNETGRTDKALFWFRKSVQFNHGPESRSQKADAYANMGDLYKEIDVDSAIVYCNKAIAIYQQNGNIYSLGKSYNNLALALMELGNNKDAEVYLTRSIGIARQIENDPMLISSGYNLSQLYNETGESRKEIALLEEIYPLISHEGMSELAFKVCLALASWHFHHGSPKKGDAFMLEYIRYHAIYFNNVNARNLSDVEKKYEVEKKEQENSLLKKSNQLKTLTIRKKQQQSVILNFVWASGLFLVVLVALLLVLRFRKKNFLKELENQKAVFEATLAERKRISFDLHDNVGSQLSYVVSNLELLNQQNQQIKTPASERIERTFKMSQEAIDSLRDTVWALHNSSITVEILSAKLESFARKVIDHNENTALDFRSAISKNKVISPEHTMHIFRIFQESVNNALKHANASVLHVSLEETAEGKLILEVTDNGKGIENLQSPEGHFGLKNMSDRASQIGAIWRIGKRESGGTSIYLEV